MARGWELGGGRIKEAGRGVAEGSSDMEAAAVHRINRKPPTAKWVMLVIGTCTVGYVGIWP